MILFLLEQCGLGPYFNAYILVSKYSHYEHARLGPLERWPEPPGAARKGT